MENLNKKTFANIDGEEINKTISIDEDSIEIIESPFEQERKEQIRPAGVNISDVSDY